MASIEDLRKELDIDLLGVVKAEPMENILGFLSSQMEKGFTTTFEDENLEARINPKFHLENAKSIFVIGMSYIHEISGTGKFKISNHARSRDYHLILKEKLEKLEDILKRDGDFNSYIQVDSGSLFEKELGRRAGFGYIGKNSLLINKTYGSYIFLGLLVVDFEVDEYSKAIEGSCGDCDLCVKACPSKAIFGDYVIDASICHSYLSQWKGEISETNNLKYIYGCDICQEVCPKNRDILKNIHEEFKPKLSSFDNINLEEFSNRQFKREFRDFSFSWVGKKTLLRNIGIIKREE